MRKEKKTEEGITFTFNYSKGGYAKKESEKKIKPKIPGWAYFILAVIIISSMTILLRGEDMAYINYLAYEKAYDARYDEVFDEISKTYILSSDAFIDKIVKENMKRSEDEIIMKAEAFSESLKSRFKDDDRLPYFFSPDDYYYLRQARYLSEKNEGIDVKNDFYSDLSRPKSLLPYVEFGLYKMMHFFDEEARIEKAAFYYPAIFGVLSVIVFFFIARYFAGIKGTLLSTAIFAFHPVFFVNSQVGFADTNSLNLFLSLIIFYFFVNISTIKLSLGKGFLKKNRDELKRLLFFSLLAAIALSVFKFAWNGYLYVALLFLVYLSSLAILNFIQSGKKRIYMVLVIPALSAGIFYFLKDSYFINALSSYILKQDSGIYASAFSTINELQPTDFSSAISMMGGKLAFVFFIIAIIYFIHLAIIKKKNEAILLVSFILPLLLAFIFAGRFVFYFIPFLAILLGSSAESFIAYLSPKMKEFFDFEKESIIEISLYAFIVGILVFSFAPVHKFFASDPDFSLPAMDDSIKEASQTIAKNSSNAIIITWWDFGYMYEYYARREVLFDGGNFEQKKLYWFSEAVLSPDINRSANIFRMLGCHAEGHIDKIISERGYESFKIIDSLLESKKIAEDTAKTYNLNSDLVNKMYCEKDIYIILSSDLRQKYWAFVNFAGSSLKKRFLKSKIEGLNFEESIAELEKYIGNSASDKYFDITQQTQKKEYFTNPSVCIEVEDGLFCKNGIMFSFNQSVAHDKQREYSYIFYGSNFSRKNLEGPQVLFYYDKIPYSLFVDPQYSESAFSKLYFGRQSTENFELFHQIPESISKGAVIYKLRS